MGANLDFVPIRKIEGLLRILRMPNYTTAAYPVTRRHSTRTKNMWGPELCCKTKECERPKVGPDTHCAQSSWMSCCNGPSLSHITCHVRYIMCLARNIATAKKFNKSINHWVVKDKIPRFVNVGDASRPSSQRKQLSLRCLEYSESLCSYVFVVENMLIAWYGL